VLNYFVASAAGAAGAAVVSTATGVVVSTATGATTVVSTAGAVSSPPLQAAKDTDTIARAKITFFIFLVFLIFKNYNLIFIPKITKGNPIFKKSLFS